MNDSTHEPDRDPNRDIAAGAEGADRSNHPDNAHGSGAPGPADGSGAQGAAGGQGPAYGPSGQGAGPYGGHGPGYTYGPAGAAYAHPSGLASDTRGWGIGAHLGALGLALISAAALGFLAPLLVWLVKRDDHPFIDHHAKEALNFQLTVLAALAAGIIGVVPVVLLGVVTFGVVWIIAGIVAIAAAIVWFVLPIIAAVKAANGEGYRYPLTIRFVS